MLHFSCFCKGLPVPGSSCRNIQEALHLYLILLYFYALKKQVPEGPANNQAAIPETPISAGAATGLPATHPGKRIKAIAVLEKQILFISCPHPGGAGGRHRAPHHPLPGYSAGP